MKLVPLLAATVVAFVVANPTFAQDFGQTSDEIIQFVPLLTLGIPFAIGNWFLAARIGQNATIWVILSLIPIVNYFFAVYVSYTVVFYVIDRLKDIAAKA
jgi:hypothetical protein